MKPERKPFVIEFKKRRPLSGKARDIWGAIDLKAATDQVAVEQDAGSGETSPPKVDAARTRVAINRP